LPRPATPALKKKIKVFKDPVPPWKYTLSSDAESISLDFLGGESPQLKSEGLREADAGDALQRAVCYLGQPCLRSFQCCTRSGLVGIPARVFWSGRYREIVRFLRLGGDEEELNDVWDITPLLTGLLDDFSAVICG
jgi:hypothetical protein